MLKCFALSANGTPVGRDCQGHDDAAFFRPYLFIERRAGAGHCHKFHVPNVRTGRVRTRHSPRPFPKKCPACGAAIAINALGALTRSRGATAAGLAGMVLGLGTCFVGLTVLGIDERTLNSWPAAWQAGLAIGVIVAGTFAAFIFQRIQVKTALARMRTRLSDEGLL